MDLPAAGGPPRADAVCEGGDLDCGSGLLLIIRRAMEPLPSGGVLEIRSREASVAEDLPAWCRMVGHEIAASAPGEGRSTSWFVRKGGGDEALGADLERARSHPFSVRVRWSGGMGATAFARNHRCSCPPSAAAWRSASRCASPGPERRCATWRSR